MQNNPPLLFDWERGEEWKNANELQIKWFGFDQFSRMAAINQEIIIITTPPHAMFLMLFFNYAAVDYNMINLMISQQGSITSGRSN